MEKIIYLISRQNEQNRDDFATLMKQAIAPQLLATKPLGLQLNIVDETVAAGDAMAMESIALKTDAVVSVWLDSSINRSPIEKILAACEASFAGYLVSESCPLRNTTKTASTEGRTPGFAQVALLQKPIRLSVEEWITIWQYSHTQIAIDDNEKLARNSQAMMESCGRFIDFDKINVSPTSEYIYKSVTP